MHPAPFSNPSEAPHACAHLLLPRTDDKLCHLRDDLIGHVLDSDVVVLLQSEKVLTCPFCLLELYAASTAGIPIVSLVCSGKGYDFEVAEDQLTHLDTSLPSSAAEVLEVHDAPVLRIAHTLSTCIPNCISVPLNSAGSEIAIQAAVVELVKAMQRANAVPVPSDDYEAWLEDREARDRVAMAEIMESSMVRGTQRGRMLRRRVNTLERKVVDLQAALEASTEKHHSKRDFGLKTR